MPILEKIVAAAIRRKDGIVFTLKQPARHADIIKYIANTTNVDHVGEPDFEQGFVTETGRWVRRKPAALMALRTGQIEKLKWPPKLYTEDLW